MWPATSGRGCRLWFAGLCLTALAFFISAQALESQHLQEKSKFIIERVEISGHQRIETRTILDRISTRPGDPYDVDAVQRDAQALRDTGYFERVRLTVEDSPDRPNGKIVVFDVLEKPIGQTTEPDAVLVRLAKVEQFAFGPTGYAGVISAGEKDFRTVLGRSSAVTDFEKLFAEGNIQAKSYALVGIQKLNPTRFKDLARPLRNSKERVTTMEGCIISDEPFSYILKQIDAGKYR